MTTARGGETLPSRRCFIISPIGLEGTPERVHTDEVFDFIITPAMEECGLKAFRSEDLLEHGKITDQMIQSIMKADFCIAVLKGYGPNVFYELAFAQAAGRPVVILMEKGEILPFDISDLRCVYYDLTIRSFHDRTYISQLVSHLRSFEATGWAVPSPIPDPSSSLDLARLRENQTAEPARSGPVAATGDTVDCSVFAPPSVVAGESAMVQVFVHIPEQATEANRMAQEFDTDAARRGVATLECNVQRGTRLTFDLVIQRLEVEGSPTSLVWHGIPASVQFAVAIPRTAELGSVIGTLNVHQGSVPVGHIKFKLDISEDVDHNVPFKTFVGDSAKRYSMAFVSYASSDRAEVVRRLQTLRAVGIEYFQDVDITPGDQWMQELYANIDGCDLFLLCWSRAAHDSEWVRKEVEYALARKGGG